MIIGKIDILDKTLDEARGVIVVSVSVEVAFERAPDTPITYSDTFEVAAGQRRPAVLTRLIRRRARNRAMAFFNGSAGRANIFTGDQNEPEPNPSENWFWASGYAPPKPQANAPAD